MQKLEKNLVLSSKEQCLETNRPRREIKRRGFFRGNEGSELSEWSHNSADLINYPYLLLHISE